MFKYPKTILSIFILFIVSFTSILAINSTPKTAEAANFKNSESKTKDSWLAITSATPDRVDGYFCVRREYFFGNEEPIKLTAFVNGRQVGSGVEDSYNSMNPYEKNCDKGDRNSFSFDLEYTKNCKKDDIVISVRSRVYGQSNTVKKSIDNPYCDSNTNTDKTVNTTKNTKTQTKSSTVNTQKNRSTKNQKTNPTKYLTVSNCINGDKNRIPTFGVSTSPSDYPSCGNLESSYVASTKLNKRYVHIAVCSKNSSNLDLDYITRLDTSDSTSNRKLCSGSMKQVEYYTIDIKNDKYLTVSNCTVENDSYDIFPSLVSKQDYNPSFENCSQYYNNRYSSNNYVLTI